MRSRRIGSSCQFCLQWYRQLIAISEVNSSDLTNLKVDSILLSSLFIVANYIQNKQTSLMGNQSVKSGPSKNKYFRSFASDKRNGEELLICQRSVPHRMIRQRWENLVVELRNIPNEHIMVPKDWKSVQNSLCGNGQVLEVTLYLVRQSTKIIQQIQKNLSKKEGHQVNISIRAKFAEVGLNCRSLGQIVGDIQPSNILMNNQGQIKVLTYLSFPNDLQTFSDPLFRVFFSPEQLEQRRKGFMKSSCDAVKSQSFAIGLTILSMVLLKGIEDIYNYSSNELRQGVLEQYIQKMKSISFHSTVSNKSVFYSSSLCEAVELLLVNIPEKRLGYTYLYHQLEPHIQKIQEFQPFQVKLIVIEQQVEKSPGKEVITLRSRHRKVKGGGSTPSDKNTHDYQVLPVYQAPMTESRFVSLQNPQKQKEVVFVGNSSLLQSIDEKLKRSREQFPS